MNPRYVFKVSGSQDLLLVLFFKQLCVAIVLRRCDRWLSRVLRLAKRLIELFPEALTITKDFVGTRGFRFCQDLVIGIKRGRITKNLLR